MKSAYISGIFALVGAATILNASDTPSASPPTVANPAPECWTIATTIEEPKVYPLPKADHDGTFHLSFDPTIKFRIIGHCLDKTELVVPVSVRKGNIRLMDPEVIEAVSEKNEEVPVYIAIDDPVSIPELHVMSREILELGLSNPPELLIKGPGNYKIHLRGYFHDTAGKSYYYEVDDKFSVGANPGQDANPKK